DASTLPARSRARTANECAPSPIGPTSSPLRQAANAVPSSEHSKLTFISFETNSKRTIVLLSAAGGALVIVVTGAAVSISHTCSAGEASPLPSPLTARTANVCGPSPRERANGDVHGAAGSPSTLHSNRAPG